MTQLAEHVERVVKRSQAFYRKDEPGHLLINAHVPAEQPAIPPLQDFDLDRELDRWVDRNLEAARPGWRAKEGLDDDGIPSICPRFGIAEHSAWLGMDVVLQETTCLPVPVLTTPEDLDRIELSESTKWFGYMESGYEHLRSRKDGSFVTSVRGTMAPMDLANAVRGDELFADFLLRPGFCHRLMNVMVRSIRWHFPRVRAWADDLSGGRVFAYGSGWMPPRTLGHLSNDAAMLCSPEVYEEFGFPYERRLVGSYDHVLYHVHNEKMHYVPCLVALPNLAMLEVARDPKTPAPIDDLARVLESTVSVNLMLHAHSGQVRDRIDELSCRNVFLQVSCNDRSDAEDIVALVRDRSRPLE